MLLMDGMLLFAYPRSFRVQYYSQEGPVVITSHDGFLEVKAGSDVQYSYDRYWLFEDFINYIFALAEYTRLPLEFSGRDEVAGCRVQRYMSAEDPDLVLWFHEESGMPFLIRQGKKTLVSVGSFIRDLEQPERITSLELELYFAREPARLHLDLTELGWVPSRLTVQEALGKCTPTSRIGPSKTTWRTIPLEQLVAARELNDRFWERFEDEDLEGVLQVAPGSADCRAPVLAGLLVPSVYL